MRSINVLIDALTFSFPLPCKASQVARLLHAGRISFEQAEALLAAFSTRQGLKWRRVIIQQALQLAALAHLYSQASSLSY